MFLLRIDGKDNTSKIGVYPGADPTYIESQYALDESKNYFSQFMPDDTSFKGMSPNYVGDRLAKSIKKHNLSDFMYFIIKEPQCISYVVSTRFKQVVEQFNIKFVKFYSGNIIANEIENQYYVFHILTKQYEYIDFSKSFFFKGDMDLNKKSNFSVSGDNIADIKVQVGHRWIFDKAVMKPEFRNVDMYFLDTYRIVISERLKLAIEEADLKGIKIFSAAVSETPPPPKFVSSQTCYKSICLVLKKVYSFT